MENKLSKSKRVIHKILTILLVYVPQIIIYFGLVIVAYNLCFFFFNGAKISISINILISVVIITATLSMISFSYLLVIKKDSNYKEIVYCGERFLHATLIIIIVLIIIWFVGYLYPVINKLNWAKYINWFFYFLAGISYVFLVNSVKYLTHGIFSLEKILNRKEFVEGSKSDKILIK
ncbi:MAG: hypothetical protein WC812_04570 [Candidatus Pacearchaeota archaeon]|jgi:hypothetical protein